jgi:hypothetical protein
LPGILFPGFRVLLELTRRQKKRKVDDDTDDDMDEDDVDDDDEDDDMDDDYTSMTSMNKNFIR